MTNTMTLRNGKTVLTKSDGNPLAYVNHTAAQKALQKAKTEYPNAYIWQPYFGPARYIVIGR